MSKRRNTSDDYIADEQAALRQPDSLTELEPVVTDFVNRLKQLEYEEEELRDRKKDLLEEFKTKLDTKTLTLALRMFKLKEKVQHKHAFDVFSELLERESTKL